MKNTILHKGGESGVIKTVDFFITPGMQLLMASTSKNIGEVDLVSRGRRTVTSASLRQGLLTDDSVSFKVISSTVLDININDTIGVFDQVYRINVLPSVRKLSNSSYEYDIVAQGLMFDMMRCKFFNTDATGFKTESEFPLIGNLELFLTVIANNMKRLSPLWSVGNFAAGGDTKTITFGDDNCLTALQKICQEFKTEFWIKHEAGQFKIHTGNFGSILPITLEYGKGKGLYSLTRNNVNDNDIITRLYVSGGTQNIPNGYKNFSRRLKLESGDYLEDTELTNFFGLKEGSITFDEIYPKRTGTISKVGDTVFKFEDSGMDFDLNEKDTDGVTTKWLIPGTSAKVHFNKGNLAGYEFEIKKNGYNSTKKEFEIIPFKNESGQQFPDPDAAAFQFNVGDEYVLLDIVMPPTYVQNAEAELLVKATEQFNLNKQAKVSYTLEVDPLFIKSLQTPIAVGDLVRIVDEPLGIDKVIRVTEITRDFITNGESTPYNFQLVIADDYEVSYASQMILEVQEIKNIVSITNLGQISYSKLGLKTTEELKNMIFDTDGYFDAENIKPNSIETNMLSVGSQSQQLSSSVVFILNKDGEVNKVEQKAGVLYSQTMDKTWTLTGQTLTIPDNSARYVYGKCSKISQSGSVLFTTEQIKFDENPNDYYFLIGILHSVVEGVRILSITIGTTTINGGLIRTGIISSLDGQTWFNLATGEIKGKITFTADSPALQQIKVGGANLLRNSDFKQDISSWFPNGTGETISWSSAERAMNIDNGGSAGAFFQHINVGAGDFVVSFDVKPYFQSGVAPYKVKVYLGDETRIVEIHSSTEYKRYKAVFSLTQPATTIVFQPMDADQRLYFKNLKLETGLIATDWTPAQEDVDAAIYEAFQQGFQANHAMTALTNDNLLTPYEKTKVAEQWGNIVNEYYGIRDQANYLGLYIDSFEDSYVDLEYYLYGNPAVLADMGADSAIDGPALRAAFANYHSEKSDILVDISDALNTKIDDFTASITDLENKTDFLSESTVAGNAIATGSLIVGNGEGANAGITGLGDANDVFLWGGKPFAGKDTAPISLTRDGFLKVRNAAGNVVFEIGQKAGKAVFNIFHEITGALVATIGDQGIVFQGYVPESYSLIKLKYCSNQNDLHTAQREAEAVSASSILLDLGWQGYKHFLSGSTIDSYQYTAGYNFESSMNQQYEGKFFESENKLGSTIPDGWYMRHFEVIIQQQPQVYISVMIHKVVGGVIMQSEMALGTKDWNQMIIM